GKAVEEGRKNSDADPLSYFVDDEKSINLFLGYTVAASRLKGQLDEKGIEINEKNPLIVYIPCGVGGAPGGVAYGLKRIFKENIHCFFVEPTLSPCMILGMVTGLHEKISVYDVGIKGITHADGLAVARPSGLVSEYMDPVLSGVFTTVDANLYDYLRILDKTENKRIEPSSCAAFKGPINLLKEETSRKYIEENIGTNIENAYHIAWATGGRMVPKEDMEKFLKTYL
ncbi:MAG: D-serine ammonia-lyase, partial [Fusobacterium sp.]